MPDKQDQKKKDGERKDEKTHAMQGDDAEAKRLVMNLVEQIGLDAVDTGTLAAGGRQQKIVISFEGEVWCISKHLHTLHSVTANTRQAGRELLDIAATILLHTHNTEFSLEQANEALLALKQGRINGAAVLNISAG